MSWLIDAPGAPGAPLSRAVSHLVSHPEDSFEGLPELRVEDGVDDGVHAGVDVP